MDSDINARLQTAGEPRIYGGFLGVNGARAVSRLFYAISLASLLAFCIFLIYPTEFSRSLTMKEEASTYAFRFLYSIDSAANCFPSLHVALAWLSALGLRDERKKAGGRAMVWSTLISISTLTTKQHYFVDCHTNLVARFHRRGLCGVA
jgi:membrane-associated phospholipid phosphatase